MLLCMAHNAYPEWRTGVAGWGRQQNHSMLPHICHIALIEASQVYIGAVLCDLGPEMRQPPCQGAMLVQMAACFCWSQYSRRQQPE